MYIMKHYTFLAKYVFPVFICFSCRLSVLVNHIEILQAIITNSVTRYCEAKGDISGEEICLRLSLTLARNLCAGVQHNQAMLW